MHDQLPVLRHIRRKFAPRITLLRAKPASSSATSKRARCESIEECPPSHQKRDDVSSVHNLVRASRKLLLRAGGGNLQERRKNGRDSYPARFCRAKRLQPSWARLA